MRWLDLYCGQGGVAAGIEQAGGHVVYGYTRDLLRVAGLPYVIENVPGAMAAYVVSQVNAVIEKAAA